MKKLNLSQSFLSASRAFQRFPLTINCSLAAAGILISMIQWNQDNDPLLIRLAYTAYLGIGTFTALALLAEGLGKQKQSLLFQLLGIPLLVLLFFSFTGEKENLDIFLFFQVGAATHLFIAFSPFLKKNYVPGHFWQFNQRLFLRFVTSLLYSGVLYVGLAMALGALHFLFELKIEKSYFHTFVLIGTIFNTWFFCSGVPADFEENVNYPKGLKVFTQYVLLPLVSLYMLILYAYILKIVFMQEWPTGWVSNLILSFSILGILALLLVFPVAEDAGNAWIRFMNKRYYFILLPLIALMAMAIWRRVSDYGITEERYVVIMLTAWLFLTTIVFGLWKKKDIRFVPLSLFLFVLLSLAGPIGALGLSARSQVKELKLLLDKNELLKEDKWIIAQRGIPVDDQHRIESILGYLDDRRQMEKLQPLLNFPLDSLKEGRSNMRDQSRLVLQKQGLSSTGTLEAERSTHYNFRLDTDNAAFSIAGYGYFQMFNTYRNIGESINIHGKNYTLVLTTAGSISINGEGDSLQIPLLQQLRTAYTPTEESYSPQNLPVETMTFEAENDRIKAKVILKSVNIYNSFEKEEIENAEGYVFLELKNEE